MAAYFCSKYPFRGDLSKARLTKMFYLADWKNALLHDEQLTEIRWFYNHYGPYVDDVLRAIEGDSRFKVTQTSNQFGSDKALVTYHGSVPELDAETREVLDHVIDKTKALNWKDFLELVYSTFPVATGQKGEFMNLVTDALAYKA